MANAYHYQHSFDDALAAEFKGILSQGFDPRHVPNLKLWLDANDSKTLLIDGSNRVSQWLDKSGLNNHATQNNITQQPLATGIINGQTALSFNNQNLIIPNLNIAPPITVFAVIIPKNYLASSTYPIYLEIDGSQYNTTGRKPMIHGIKPSPNRMALQFGNNNAVPNIIDNSLTYIELSTDNNILNSAINGNASSANLANKPIVASSSLGKIGANGGQAIWGEIIIYNGILSAEESQKTRLYLSNKWG